MDISKLQGFTPGPYWTVKVRDGSPGEMPAWSLHAHHPSRTGAGFKMGEIEGFQDATTERTAQLLASATTLLELARMGLELAELFLKATVPLWDARDQTKAIKTDHLTRSELIFLAEKARALRDLAKE